MRSYSGSVSTQITEKSDVTWSRQHALHHVEIVINQRRRFGRFGARLDVVPQAFQETNVSPQLFFAGTCAAVRTIEPP